VVTVVSIVEAMVTIMMSIMVRSLWISNCTSFSISHCYWLSRSFTVMVTIMMPMMSMMTIVMSITIMMVTRLCNSDHTTHQGCKY